MRSSKKVWLIVVIVIFAVVIGLVFSTYFRMAAEERELNDRLTLAQTRLPGLLREHEDLQNQLLQAESKLASSAAKFPQSVESIEYGEDLFRVAYGSDLRTMLTALDLELTNLSASAPTARTVGAVTYSVSSFTVGISGDVNNILSFIDAIGTQIDYRLPGWSFQVPWSVEVKSVNVNVGGGAASISLDIYGYKR
jgi:flagellar basal body-associated protein FliL